MIRYKNNFTAKALYHNIIYTASQGFLGKKQSFCEKLAGHKGRAAEIKNYRV